MSNKEQNIDQAFRSKFEGFELTPDPSVWNAIEADLERKKRKKVLLWIQRSGVAAVVALAFTMGWYFSKNYIENQFDSHTAQQVISFPNIQLEEVTPVINKIEQPVFHRIKPQEQTMRLAMVQEYRTVNELAALNAKSEQLIAKNEPAPKLVKLNNNELSELDRQIIAMNLSHMATESKERNAVNNWIVGAQVAPSFNYANQGGGNDLMFASVEETSSGNNAASSFESTFAGVVNFAYERNNRLKFETGVGYRSLVQQIGSVNLTGTNSNQLSFADFNSSELKSATLNSIILPTDLGLASVNLPNGTQVATVQAEIFNSYNKSSEIENYEISQNANYVEIPFNIYYKLIDGKVDLNAIGGLNTNLLVSNFLTLDGAENKYKGGGTQGLNTLTFSSNIGVGIEYDLIEHIRFSMEPIMKIQLSSLNENSRFNARPFNFGLLHRFALRFLTFLGNGNKCFKRNDFLFNFFFNLKCI